jgi:hypothetical protein
VQVGRARVVGGEGVLADADLDDGHMRAVRTNS